MSLHKIAHESYDRSRFLGGSDVAAILGISPYRTALDVYLDKVEGRRPDDPAKAQIFRRGARMEPYILDLLIEEHGIQIAARGNRYQDKELPFLAAEIDAESTSGENIEVKSANQFAAKNWGAEWTDEIPVYYAAQGMHGMMITGAEKTLFPVLIGSDDFRVYKLDRDEETIAGIRSKELEFWERIQRRDPPPATSVGDIMRLFEKDDGGSVEASEEMVSIFHQLKQIEARIKVDEADVEELEKQIKLYLGEHSTLKFGAKTLLTWKSQDTKRFDSTAFKAAHPSIFDKFTKTTTSRVMRLK